MYEDPIQIILAKFKKNGFKINSTCCLDRFGDRSMCVILNIMSFLYLILHWLVTIQ